MSYCSHYLQWALSDADSWTSEVPHNPFQSNFHFAPLTHGKMLQEPFKLVTFHCSYWIYLCEFVSALFTKTYSPLYKLWAESDCKCCSYL